MEAATTTLLAITPSFSFGALASGDGVSTSLTLLNLTDNEVTVTLSTFTSIEGIGTSDLVSVAPSSLTIAARTSGDATITLGPVGLNAQGWYEGRVTATHPRGELTVPYLFKVENSSDIEVSPASFDETSNFLESVSGTLTIINTGFGELSFELRALEQLQMPVPPSVMSPLARGWEDSLKGLAEGKPTAADALLTPVPLAFEPLDTVIVDPAGDAIGSPPLVDVIRVDAALGDQVVTLRVFFTDATLVSQASGFIHLDVDQDRSTGVPPTNWFGRPEQDIGLDFFVFLEPGDNLPSVSVFDAHGTYITEVPAEYIGQSIEVVVPLSALGDDDGNMDITLVVGNISGVEAADWAPDEGHGAIGSPLFLAEWLCFDPSSGAIGPKSSGDVTVSLNCLGDLEPGVYAAEIVIRSNDPDEDRVAVPVSLKVVEGHPPEIDVTPRFLEETLGLDQVLVTTLSLSNLDTTGSGEVLTCCSRPAVAEGCSGPFPGLSPARNRRQRPLASPALG